MGISYFLAEQKKSAFFDRHIRPNEECLLRNSYGNVGPSRSLRSVLVCSMFILHRKETIIKQDIPLPPLLPHP